jgi:hypothetical protein
MAVSRSDMWRVAHYRAKGGSVEQTAGATRLLVEDIRECEKEMHWPRYYGIWETFYSFRDLVAQEAADIPEDVRTFMFMRIEFTMLMKAKIPTVEDMPELTMVDRTTLRQTLDDLRRTMELNGLRLDTLDGMVAGNRGSGGCFVATAVYESGHHPTVYRLRVFRDAVLSRSSVGLLFIQAYARYGPFAARLVTVVPVTRMVLRPTLDALAWILRARPWRG